MSEKDYEEKLKSVKRFIPFLEYMIEQLKDPQMKNREAQLYKMESLHNMITDTNRKLKLDTLSKCEEVILKLYEKVKGKNLPIPPVAVSTSKSSNFSPSSPTYTSKPVIDIYGTAGESLRKNRSTAEEKPPHVNVYDSARESLLKKAQNNFPSIYDSARESLLKNEVNSSKIPSVNVYDSARESLLKTTAVEDNFNDKTCEVVFKKPPISMEDLEGLEKDVESKIDLSSNLSEDKTLSELKILRNKLCHDLEEEEEKEKKELININTTVRNKASFTKINPKGDRRKSTTEEKTSDKKTSHKKSSTNLSSRIEIENKSDKSALKTTPTKTESRKELSNDFASILSEIDKKYICGTKERRKSKDKDKYDKNKQDRDKYDKDKHKQGKPNMENDNNKAATSTNDQKNQSTAISTEAIKVINTAKESFKPTTNDEKTDDFTTKETTKLKDEDSNLQLKKNDNVSFNDNDDILPSKNTSQSDNKNSLGQMSSNLIQIKLDNTIESVQKKKEADILPNKIATVKDPRLNRTDNGSIENSRLALKYNPKPKANDLVKINKATTGILNTSPDTTYEKLQTILKTASLLSPNQPYHGANLQSTSQNVNQNSVLRTELPVRSDRRLNDFPGRVPFEKSNTGNLVPMSNISPPTAFDRSNLAGANSFNFMQQQTMPNIYQSNEHNTINPCNKNILNNMSRNTGYCQNQQNVELFTRRDKQIIYSNNSNYTNFCQPQENFNNVFTSNYHIENMSVINFQPHNQDGSSTPFYEESYDQSFNSNFSGPPRTSKFDTDFHHGPPRTPKYDADFHTSRPRTPKYDSGLHHGPPRNLKFDANYHHGPPRTPKYDADYGSRTPCQNFDVDMRPNMMENQPANQMQMNIRVNEDNYNGCYPNNLNVEPRIQYKGPQDIYNRPKMTYREYKEQKKKENRERDRERQRIEREKERTENERKNNEIKDKEETNYKDDKNPSVQSDNKDQNKDTNHESNKPRNLSNERRNPNKKIRDSRGQRSPSGDRNNRSRSSNPKRYESSKFDKIYAKKSSSNKKPEEKEFVSPLDSLYFTEQSKTGKGYGKQSYKIPKKSSSIGEAVKNISDKPDSSKEQSNGSSKSGNMGKNDIKPSTNLIKTTSGSVKSSKNDIPQSEEPTSDDEALIVKKTRRKKIVAINTSDDSDVNETDSTKSETCTTKKYEEDKKTEINVPDVSSSSRLNKESEVGGFETNKEIENKNTLIEPKDENVSSTVSDKKDENAVSSESLLLSKFFSNLMGSSNKNDKKTALLSLISTFSDSFSDNQLKKITNILQSEDQGDDTSLKTKENLENIKNDSEIKDDNEQKTSCIDTTGETPKEVLPKEEDLKPAEEKNDSHKNEDNDEKTEVENPDNEKCSNVQTTEGHIKDKHTKSTAVVSSDETKKKPTKHKTELDLLHEDIREMFIRDGVITATGKRMCRMLKDNSNTLVKSKDKEHDKEKETKKDEIVDVVATEKLRTLRVVLPKVNIGELLNESKRRCRAAPKNKDNSPSKNFTECELSDNELSNDVSEDEHEIKSNKKTSRKKRGQNWASGIIKTKNKSKAKPLKTSENTTGKENDKINMETYVHDKNYFSFKASKKMECLVCKNQFAWMSRHYAVFHPEVEVLSARLSPDIAEEAIKDAIKNKEIYASDEKKMSAMKCIKHFTCRACNVDISTEKPKNCYDHISTHTGEFRWKCPFCKEKYAVKQAVMEHITLKHVEERILQADIDRIKQGHDLVIYKGLYAYLCDQCNFYQMNPATVEKHVKTYHKNATIYKFSMNLRNVIEENDESIEKSASELPIADEESVSDISEIGIKNDKPKLSPRTSITEAKAELKTRNDSNTTIPTQGSPASSDSKDVSSVSDVLNDDSDQSFLENTTKVTAQTRKSRQRLTRNKKSLIDEKSDNSKSNTHLETSGVTRLRTRKNTATDESQSETNLDIQQDEEIVFKRRTRSSAANEKKLLKEDPVTQKPIDESVFTTKNDILLEDEKKIEEERMKKMQDINNSLQARTSLEMVDKIKNKLKQEAVEINHAISIKSEPMEDMRPLSPPRIEVFDKTSRKMEIPQLVKIPSNLVAPKENKRMANVIEELQERLNGAPPVENFDDISDEQDDYYPLLNPPSDIKPFLSHDINCPPPLTELLQFKQKENHKDVKVLAVGPIKLIKSDDNVIFYLCCQPPCILSSNDQQAFANHCQFYHEWNENEDLFSKGCNDCNKKYDFDINTPISLAALNHAINDHAEFIGIKIGSIRISKNLFSNQPNETAPAGDKTAKSPIKSAKQKESDSLDDKLINDYPPVLHIPENTPFSKICNVLGSVEKEAESVAKDNVESVEDSANDSTPMFKIADVVSLAEEENELEEACDTPNDAVVVLNYSLKTFLNKDALADNTYTEKQEQFILKGIIKEAIEQAQNFNQTIPQAKCYLFPLYKCPKSDCLFSGNTKKQFMLHAETHRNPFTDISKELLLCVYCKSVSSYGTMGAHYEKFHNNCYYACGTCIYRCYSNTKTCMDIHQTINHWNETCDTLIVSNQHRKDIDSFDVQAETPPHSKTTLYKCCNYEFLFLDQFCKHLQSVKHPTLIPCRYMHKHVKCPAKPMSKEEYLEHLCKVHNCYRYQCVYCNFGSFSSDIVLLHLLVKHPWFPAEIYDRRSQPNNFNPLEVNFKEQIKIKSFNFSTLLCKIQKAMKDMEDLDDIAITSFSSSLSVPLLSKPSKVYSSKGQVSDVVTNVNYSNQLIINTDSSPTLPKLVPLSTTVASAQPLFILLENSADTAITSPKELTPPTKQTLSAEKSITNIQDKILDTSENETQIINPELEEDLIQIVHKPSSDPLSDPLSLDNETVPEATLQVDSTVTSRTSEYDSDSHDVESASNSNSQVGLVGHRLYRCAWCSISFPKIDGLKQHILTSQPCIMKGIEGNQSRPFRCAHCGRYLKNVQGLLCHITYHGQLRFHCALCSEKFPHVNPAKDHLTRKHNIKQVMTVPLIKGKNNANTDDFIVKPKQSENLDAKLEEAADISKKSEGTKTEFLFSEINQIPLKSILGYDVVCGHCKTFKNKVRTNIIRHLQLHQSDDITVPDTAPVNPVPCLEKNEKMFDKMINLAGSSNQSGNRMGGMGPKNTESLKESKTKKKYEQFPQFVPSTRRFSCCAIDCNYLCLEEGNLRHHLEALHSSEYHFVCVHCKMTIQDGDVDSIIKHLKLHDLHLYKCSVCTYVHNLKHKVEAHLANVKHKKGEVEVIRAMDSEPWEELHYNPMPVSIDGGKAQLSIVGKPWRCGFCKHRSPTEKEVTAHLKNKHDVDYRYKCSLCPFQSMDLWAFQPHILNEHKISNYTGFIISAYTKEEDPKVDGSKETESFDTTPIWQRDKPRLRHIRGILFEEEETPTKSNKKQTSEVSSGKRVARKRSSSSAPEKEPPSKIKTKEIIKDEEHVDPSIIGDAKTPKEKANDASDDVILILDDDDELNVPVEKKMEKEISAVENDVITVDDEPIAVEDEPIAVEDEPIAVEDENIAVENDNIAVENENIAVENKNIAVENENITVERENNTVEDENVVEKGQDVDNDEMVALCAEFGDFGMPTDSFLCPKCNISGFDSFTEFVHHLTKELNIYRFKCPHCVEKFIGLQSIVQHMIKDHKDTSSESIIKELPKSIDFTKWVNLLIERQTEIIQKLGYTVTKNNEDVRQILDEFNDDEYENEATALNWSSLVETAKVEVIHSIFDSSMGTKRSLEDDEAPETEKVKRQKIHIRCPICTFRTTSPVLLEHHFSETGHDVLRCALCADGAVKCTGTMEELKKHFNENHRGRRVFVYRAKCPVCMAKFCTIPALKGHVTKNHENVIFSSFINTDDEEVTMEMILCLEKSKDNRLKTYRCTECNYVSTHTNSKNVMKHIRRVHYKSVKCNYCNQRFEHRRAAEVHSLKDHQTKELSITEDSECFTQGTMVINQIIEEAILESKTSTLSIVEPEIIDIEASGSTPTKLPNILKSPQMNTKSLVAEKSTVERPKPPKKKQIEMETEYSFYGNKPTEYDLSKIMITVPENGSNSGSDRMTCQQFMDKCQDIMILSVKDCMTMIIPKGNCDNDSSLDADSDTSQHWDNSDDDVDLVNLDSLISFLDKSPLE